MTAKRWPWLALGLILGILIGIPLGWGLIFSALMNMNLNLRGLAEFALVGSALVIGSIALGAYLYRHPERYRPGVLAVWVIVCLAGIGWLMGPYPLNR
jgi:hypothetical protein